jgi:hypothetical protein
LPCAAASVGEASTAAVTRNANPETWFRCIGLAYLSLVFFAFFVVAVDVGEGVVVTDDVVDDLIIVSASVSARRTSVSTFAVFFTS